MATTLTAAQVTRLWLERQGLLAPRGAPLTRRALVDHLEVTGGLQLDSINVLDRAHYLTIWSRFGAYDRDRLDRWIHDERAGFEYWAHEASVLPLSHLPLARRRMRRFPPKTWTARSWWDIYRTSTASKRRVLRRLRTEGPLESGDFDRRPDDGPVAAGGGMPLSKEDARSLKLLWHAGKVAVRGRRHFRCIYDLADRVYPDGPVATTAEYEDSWLLRGLRGNGVASERQLVNYITGPALDQAARRRVIARNLRTKTIVEVRIAGLRGPCYALPGDLDALDRIEEPAGTTLLSPFDSLLWQRERAEALTGFRYRVEIYVPAAKREFGYYVLPILHDGRLVGRLEPKLHRDRAILEVRNEWMEAGVRRDRRLDRALDEALDSLREFVGADRVDRPARRGRVSRPSRTAS